MSKKTEVSFEYSFLKSLIIGIGEIAMMADIPTRQIRYWEDKGYIESLTTEDGKNRRYNYLNAKKIMLIKQYMENGFSLDGAALKTTKKLNKK